MSIGGKTLKEKIIDQKPFILWAEVALLLHDIGKLSEAFLKYRQEWRELTNGWDKDPHGHDFLDKHDPLINLSEFKNVHKWFYSHVTINGKTISIADIVHKHVKPEDGKSEQQRSLLRMVKAADGKDAALDRNNPLFTADQKDKIYDTDVFGVENKFIEPSVMEKHRRQLYQSLSSLKLPDGSIELLWDDRVALLNAIRNYFEKGFSDTTRPDNDTSLWEHCYAVASIFKVILVHQIIYGEKLDDFKKVRFGIWGIGWDGLSYLSMGHKIGDITGRKAHIDSLKASIKEMAEWEYLLGNTIYEDDNGIFFLIPLLPSEIDLDRTNFADLSDYGKLLQEIQCKIIDTALRVTGGDIFPKFHLVQDTRFMTHLVRCIAELKKKINYPIFNPSSEMINKIAEDWRNAAGKTVCPICRRRPQEEKWGICKSCNEIRRKGSFFVESGRKENDKTVEPAGTPFISEIVLGNRKKSLKRAALIVAKFGLERWLDGRMVRSLFITEAKGIEKELEELGKTKSFEREESEIREWLSHSLEGNLINKGYDYQRIRKEIDLCYHFDECPDGKKKDYAKNTLFLYDRRIIYDKGKKESILNRKPGEVFENWNDFKRSAIEEYGLYGKDTQNLLYNILCVKTPTPSTVLDVWKTTAKFLKSFTEKEENGTLLGIYPVDRWKANIPKPEGVAENAAYEGKIGNIPIEVVWRADNDAWIIGDIETLTKGSVVSLKGKPFGRIEDVVKDVKYFPLRIITTTPDLFMAIVPADKAIEVSQNIYKKYISQFGKVIGRLPLSIGNIFFTEKTPMFVVLDAGKRMVNNFERLHKQQVELRVGKDYRGCTMAESNLSIPIDEVTFPGGEPLSTSMIWKVPYQLGNQEIDYYHPYFIIKKGSKDYSSRKNYFRTVVGEVIHFTEVQPGDAFELYPNYYDFEFLDATTRRYDLSAKKGRRHGGIGKSTKPFLTEDFLYGESAGLEKLWKTIKEEIRFTDTQLRNIESLWATKFLEWEKEGNKNGEGLKEWERLVRATLKKEVKEFSDKGWGNIERYTLSGLFFDCLELKLRILKKRVSDKEEESA